MLINRANLNDTFRNLSAIYSRNYEETPSQWEKIAMLVSSSGAFNDYPWTDYFPAMQEWIGERTIKQLQAYKYTVRNKDWEATIAVKENDLRDDNLGVYGIQAANAGYAAKQFPDELIFKLVSAGFINLCYDGKPFYSAEHPVGENAVSNTSTVRLAVDTFANARKTYGAARIAMVSRKDYDGRPLNIMPDTLVVGPGLEAEANILMMAPKFKDDDPNPYVGQCKVVMDSRIKSATEWHLLDTKKPLKPFIYQEREKPRFRSQTDTGRDDGLIPDSVFLRKEFLYGVDCRANGGYGLWQMAFASTGADDPA